MNNKKVPPAKEELNFAQRDLYNFFLKLTKFILPDASCNSKSIEDMKKGKHFRVNIFIDDKSVFGVLAGSLLEDEEQEVLSAIKEYSEAIKSYHR